MYAQTIRISLKPDQVDEFRELYEEYIVPELGSREGCRNFYLLLDPENARAISMTLWENRQYAEQSEEANLYLEQRAGYPLYREPPEREGYEVPIWK